MIKLFILISLFSALYAKPVQWSSSILKGFEQAKLKKTAVILDLYIDSCNYCKILQSRVYPNESVQKHLKKFIPVRLNAEKFPNLVTHYQVKGYPTILFLDKNGAVIDKVTGLPTPEMLSKKLEYVYQIRDYESMLLEKLKKEPENVSINFNLGIYYYNSDEKDKAFYYFEKSYLSKEPDVQKKKHDALFNLGIASIEIEKYSVAQKYWTEYLEKFPNGDKAAAFYYKGIANSQLGNIQMAQKDLEKALSYTTDPSEKAKIEGMIKAITED